ncbi:MAG: hypothetical protein NTX84_08395 [Nitrospirae bacterium]|nr:hypothetical protein [Nitrospirota bacterium]
MRVQWYGINGLLLSGLLWSVLASAHSFAQQVNAPAAVVERMIIDHKTEFKLMEWQERQLRSLLTELAEVRSRQRARLEVVTHELTELLKEEVSVEQEESLRVALSFEELEVMRRIDAVLSPEQLTHWRNIQEPSRHEKR